MKMATPNDSLRLIRKDMTLQAATITALVEEQKEVKEILHEIKTDRALRKMRDDRINEKFEEIKALIEENKEDIDTKFKAIVSVGKWLAIAAGGALISAFVTFIVKGGLVV